MLSALTSVNSQKINDSFIFICETSSVCRHNDVTLVDVDSHGKCSTGRENFNNILHSIISRSGVEIFVYINCILTKLCHQKRGCSLIFGTPCIYDCNFGLA